VHQGIVKDDRMLADTLARLVDASEQVLYPSGKAREATVDVSAELRRLHLMVALNPVLALVLLAAVRIALR
jgi:hypothetical protein